MLSAIALSIVLGMLFRKHESILRIMIVLLSIAVTILYYVFADRLM
ncbi:MAG: hypothetical protein AB7P40_01615 [Chloroflexota bacterium]